MNQYETGKHVPDILTLKHIAKVLKLPLAYFYAEEETLAKIISIYSSLNKKEKAELLTTFNRSNKNK